MKHKYCEPFYLTKSPIYLGLREKIYTMLFIELAILSIKVGKKSLRLFLKQSEF